MPLGRKTKAPAAPALKAQGATNKCTPQSAFDGAAGKDVYEPEKVVAQRTAKGVTQFQVKWVGYESKHNTWEPIEEAHAWSVCHLSMGAPHRRLEVGARSHSRHVRE